MDKLDVVNVYKGFPGGSDSKASACNAGDLGSIPRVGKIPWRRKWQSTPVLLPGKFHGQRSLVGYSPWDCKELDMTEQLNFTYADDTTLKAESEELNSLLMKVKEESEKVGL